MAPRSTVALSLGDGQNDSALRATKRLSLQKAKHIYLKPQTALLMQKKKKSDNKSGANPEGHCHQIDECLRIPC